MEHMLFVRQNQVLVLCLATVSASVSVATTIFLPLSRSMKRKAHCCFSSTKMSRDWCIASYLVSLPAACDFCHEWGMSWRGCEEGQGSSAERLAQLERGG